MKTGYLTSLILLLLSWITIVHSKCSDTENQDGFAIGTLICDADGNYEVKQCDMVTGRCFCVDRITGVEIPGTSKPPGEDTVDCETVQPGKEATTTATPETQTTTSTSTTEDLELNFDENDQCYKQNKKTYDYWNDKMKSYEEQVQRWQQSMTEYENYIKSLESDNS